MPTNPYFNQTTFTPEQHLIEDLVEEAIKIHGHEMFYLRREEVNLDTLLGEDTLQKFSTAVPIEMYIKTHGSFAGQSSFVSKFGLQIEDRMDLSVSVRRFHQVFPDMDRPREGDLIWLQMTPGARYIFDIRYVENQEQFFELGKLYAYELRCEMMNYAHERVATPEPIINSTTERQAYTIELTLSTGSGTYTKGETVYQGDNLITAGATGMVVLWNSTTKVLKLQNITGTFTNTGGVVLGATSNASYLPAGTPTIAPTSRDPISDNKMLQDDGPTVIVSRGTNPRFS